MRIEFLTQADPLYILPFFEEFFRHYAEEFTVARVSCCPVMGKRSRRKLLADLLVLYRPVGFLRLLAASARARLLQRLPRERRAARYYGLRQLCRAYAIEYAGIANPNAPEFLAGVRERQADLLVSVACPFILKAPLLELPPLGCLNIHHAPLPRYKGMMPTFWQMRHGESQVGVTVHRMTPRLDEGRALARESLAILPGETLHALIRRAKRQGAHAMARALHAAQAGEAGELIEGEGSYFSFPDRGQIRAFHARGLRAI